MLLREFCSHFRVVRFALGGAHVRFNQCVHLVNARGCLNGGTRRRVWVITPCVTSERIHAVELIFSLGPSNQALGSFHPDPPILAPVTNDLGGAVPQTTCVVLLCNESAIVFSPPLAFGPNVRESFSSIHVPQDDVARLKSQFRYRL